VQIKFQGNTVNFATGGVEVNRKNPIVLLVHGAGMDRTVWNLQTRYLAHHGYTALAVDLPGHGASTGELIPSIDQMANWLSEIIEHIDMGPARIIGHSMGSLIGIELAAKSPLNVDRLVLMGTALSMPVHPDLLQAASNNEALAPDLITAWSLGTKAHIAMNPAPGFWMRGGSQALLRRAPNGVIYNDLTACNSYMAGTSPSLIECPVTIFIGDEDKMTPPKASLLLAAEIKNVELIHLGSVGHMMMSEAPAKIRPALSSVLE
jgi:pimeloyl-ACP methyl ester carboxylesterase